MNYADPSGHSAVLTGLIIGAIIGAGIGAIIGAFAGLSFSFSIPTLGWMNAGGALVFGMTGTMTLTITGAQILTGVGVARKAILNAVKHPIRVINQGAKGIKYVGKLATVVLNTAGKVITAWATTSAGWRNIIILCFILGLLNDNKNY